MSICDDPFVILGVSPETSAAEVKRAYRRLVMHWHPDRNPSATAEAEFKRVHAAYELFLDPQRLAAWREAQLARSAKEGRRPAGEAAGPDGGEAAGAGRGDDLTLELTLTLEEAALGCRKTVDLVHRVACGKCRASGRVQHRNSLPCHRCSGCGRVARRPGGTSVCTGCGGRGYLRESDCPDCTGSGWLPESRTLAVTVPPGLLDGERLRLARQAPLPPGGGDGKAGDLYLEIRLAAHPLFVLRGRDVHCQVPVSIYRLLCGGRIEVPSLSGTTTLELSPEPPQALEYRLPGLGFPNKRRSAAGDLVLQLQSVYPASVRPKDVELLERLEVRLSSDLERRAPTLAAWEEQLRARRNPASA
ncbi:MAG: DnaJ domain-containing protein [Candidatus Accumulibacter sp.]|uniref:DnaJ C-terminal domain-containing protein n=1 Tax=Accumulibacter sp. TaxID=2053492 RepID=UPI0025F026E2|nr:DnaJ C-terminal domain-containing protein [Accumulibacter sp.]MCP5247666.1 DnaJ domain-containing protein [Accumulibacter sp.]